MSNVLEREQRLVRAQGLRRLEGSSLSLHRFQHNLFQKYLYDTLNEAERAYLHGDVGAALERLYAGHPDELAAVAPQPARHFLAAGVTGKAVQYLEQAGQRATRMSAHDEAAAYFAQALELLHTLPDTAERAQRELALQSDLAVSLVPTKGWASPEMTSVLSRAQSLYEQVEAPALRFGTLWFAHTYRFMRGDYPQALELLNQCRALAERSEDEGLILAVYYALTSISFFMGEFTTAVAYGARVDALYDPRQHHVLTYLIVGHDPGTQAQEAAGQSLWMLGYPNQARERLREAVALAEQLGHPYTLTLAYITDSVVASLCRDWPTVKERAERALGISQEHGFPIGEALSRSELGLALARHGLLERGIAQLERGLLAWKAGEMFGLRSQILARLVDAYLVAGRLRAGLDTVDEALDLVAKSQECLWEAELHRLKGELLLIEVGDEVEAEAERAYRQAVEVARRQSAKSWELRATMSLARLWGRQGRRAEARDTLAEIYGWFTEGFDTGDLMEAAALLDELSGT